MSSLKESLDRRFGDYAATPAPDIAANETLERMARRGVVRRFKPEPVPAELIETLIAVALSSPSKSDLQGRDVLIVDDPAMRQRINALLADQDWIPAAPHFIVFLGNNRRQRQVHEWRGHAFANDHLDAFFNAAVDAGIALSAFVTAAEAAGLGCCPVSVIRNHAAEVSRMFKLPDHVFPVAGMGFGWPAVPMNISARLQLGVTVHRNTFTDCTREMVAAYDKRRNGVFPYRAQRNVARFGTSPDYGWSEEKARHYASPERADFGAFIKAKGFKLE